MQLLLENGEVFINHLHFCYARPGNGRTNLQPGRYSVTAQFSHAHSRHLANVEGLGWAGAWDDDGLECDIVLGRVLGHDGVIPCTDVLQRLLRLLEVAEDRGEAVTLEVRHG